MANMLILGGSLSIDWAREAHWIAALVLLPTLLGHTLFNNAMRYFRGQLVALAAMCQFVFATPMAYLYFGEQPSWTFYPAAGLAVLGGAIAVVAHRTADDKAVKPTAQSKA